MPRTDHAGRPWRERVTAIARENRELHQRHPWVVTNPTTRPTLGPGEMVKNEHELRAFDGLGLTDVEMDACLTHLLGFVASTARAALDARTVQQATGMTDRQWWNVNQPLLTRIFDESRFPTAVRVGAAAGLAHGAAFDPDYAYEFGLQRVLDGFATLIEQRTSPG